VTMDPGDPADCHEDEQGILPVLGEKIARYRYLSAVQPVAHACENRGSWHDADKHDVTRCGPGLRRTNAILDISGFIAL